MMTIIGISALIIVACAMLAWALHSLVPYAVGAVGIIILNIPNAPRVVQYGALGLTFVCLVVSCINQHKVPEGATKTNDQKHSESRADRYAVYAILLAVFYTVATWAWKLLDWLGVDTFLAWLWKRNLPVPVLLGGLVLAFVTYRLVRRARRKARQQTAPRSSNPTPTTNLSSVS